MRTYFDLPYKENATEMQLFDLYLPDHDNFDTIIWFHGGGMETGSRKDAVIAPSLVEKGFGFVSAEYRMYPDAHFPEFIEDAAAAVAYIIRHITEYGGSGKVYVSGESAGAYLTMMLCMDQRYLENVGVRQDQIAAYISDSAQQFCHFNVLREFGEDGRLERIDERAPIFFIKEGFNLRPLLLLYYNDDIKCRPEETKLMYASLIKLLPDNLIDIAELPGPHCQKPQDEDGSYTLVRKVCKFIEKCRAAEYKKI